MAFPLTAAHDATVELQLSDATWVDVTDYLYDRDGLSIDRGRSDESSEVEQSTATFTLANISGAFSPRNPMSPYYGQLGRNSPVRISVARGARRLVLPGGSGDEVTAPDATALGITGDIDIRIDLTTPDWSGANLCGKYATVGNQRSWCLQTRASGRPMFTWSTDGTNAASTFVQSTMTLPLYPGRRAIRVTLDVNNGASGSTATFYTADTISGPWTQLGDPVITAGITSIFDSSAGLELGDIDNLTLVNGTGTVDDASPVVGAIHAFELRNGIGGTVVANPDFTAQAEGAVSFTDAASSPNTWTLQGNAEITNRRWRFHGDLSDAKARSDLSGIDVYAPMVASGVFQRISQGAALRSPFYRGLTTPSAVTPIAYWPMEDADGSTSFASALPNGQPMTFNGSPTLATSDAFPGSAALPTCGNANFDAKIPFTQQTTGVVQARFLLALPAGGTTDGAIAARLWTTGSIRRWDLRYNTVSNGSFTLLAYDRDLTQVHSSGGTSPFNGKALSLSIRLTQSGADVTYGFGFTDTTRSVAATTILGTVAGQTFGQVTTVNFDPNLNMDDVTIGHLSVHSVETSIGELQIELGAFVGETAGRRAERLCAEEGIPFRSIGNLDATEVMGVQTPETLATLLNECAAADGGILYEPREVFGAGYRTRDSLYNQAARVALVTGQLDGAPAPVDDDQRTRNDATVSRKGGSSARETLTSGVMSTQLPPDGVGTYEDSTTVNIIEDLRLPHHARWRVHLGTVDEARWPTIPINLAATEIAADTALVESLLEFEFGDLLTLDSLPAWLPPDQVTQLIQGYSETLNLYGHRMSLNCSPGSPWRVAVYDTDRYDTAGAETAAAIGTSDTSVPVLTTSGPIWTTTAADMPFDIKAGGERMTVTAIASAVSDTFARTASSGWGSADSGQAWTTTGGSAADYSVSGGFGRHSIATLSVNRWTTCPAPSADFDWSVSVATSAAALTSAQFVYLAARWTDADNNYLARLDLTPAGTIGFTIRKRVATVETNLGGGTVAGLTHGASTRFGVRFRGHGSTLEAKVWLASAGEPLEWHVSVTDSDLTAAGSIGFRTLLGGTNTNTLPVTATFDDLTLLNPQTMTVARSVNGIVKSHLAGTAVSLANPVPYAL